MSDKIRQLRPGVLQAGQETDFPDGTEFNSATGEVLETFEPIAAIPGLTGRLEIKHLLLEINEVPSPTVKPKPARMRAPKISPLPVHICTERDFEI